MSITHLVIILIIVVLLFGAGRVPQIMGDVARGLKEFRKNIKDDSKDVDSH